MVAWSSRRLRGLALVLFSLGLLGLGLNARAQVPPLQVPEARLLFGMQSLPKFDEGRGVGAWSGSRTRGLAMHRDLGVQLSREGCPWRLMEPAPDTHPNEADLDDAIARCGDAGIAVELMVTGTPCWASTAPGKDPARPETFQAAPPIGLYEPLFDDGTDEPGPGKHLNPRQLWGAFLARLAERYRGRVRYYQLWNEPDYPSGDLRAAPGDALRSWQGSVEDYARLMRVGRRAISWKDPQAKVVTGGLGHPIYLESLLGHGAGPDFDALDFHAYGGPGSDEALRAFLSLHAKLSMVLRRHGLQREWLCSETGYPSEDAPGQAAYIPKLYATALALGLTSVAYYTNTNPSWREMGLVDWRTMRRPTAGYEAYRVSARALAGLHAGAKLAEDPRVVAYRFVGDHGREVLAAWAPWASRPVPWCPPALSRGAWTCVTAAGATCSLVPGRPVMLDESPVFLDSHPSAYPMPPSVPPLMVGARALMALQATLTDSSGFHEAALAVDGDPDTEWVGQDGARLTLRLAPGPALRGVVLKTGPLDGRRIGIEASRDGKTWWEVASARGWEDWSAHEVAFGAPMDVSWIRLVWEPGKGGRAPACFDLRVE